MASSTVAVLGLVSRTKVNVSGADRNSSQKLETELNASYTVP